MVDTRQFASESNKSLLGIEGALQDNAILQHRYRIEGVLGVGGMGSVYKARDMQFPDAKRYVAVKEMLQQSTDPELRNNALRNFQREANILAGLSHPAIPTIHDYFSTKERAYVVMEFIDGSDMDSIINKFDGFLPIEDAIKWCITLCDVLDYLHTSESPIVFRDIKPSNIMIDIRGQVRLIDFGIAKHFDPDTKGTMIGTEGYAAPESYRGLATPLSDVFGVGATMHHILTRHDPRLDAPFTFADRPIREANPNVPMELQAIVMKSLAYTPEERFQSASEFKAALESLLSGVGTRVLSTSGSGGLNANETRTWDDGGSLDIGAGITPRWQFKAEEEIRSTPTVSGKQVFVTVYDNNLYALDADTGQLKWKYPADDVIASSPVVSEPENLVVFGSKDRSLYAVDTRTGRIRWTFQAEAPIYSTPNIQHGHVFVGSDDGRLYAIRVNTGRKAWEASNHDPVRCRPAVMEDRIIYGTMGGDLIAVDLSGQMKWRFTSRKGIISSPLIQNGLAIFGSLDGNVYAVDAETSWSVWKFNTNNAVVSSPCFGEDKVYVGSGSGELFAIDLDGREKWRFDTESKIASSPIYADGFVYLGANNNKVYCIEAKSGVERWSYETDGIVPGSPTIHDGIVYIGSADHHLYAFKA